MIPVLKGRRLAITTDAVGGIWRYAMDVAAGFAARGVKVTLIGLGPAPGPGKQQEAAAAGVHLDWLDNRLDWTVADAAAATALAQDLGRRVAAVEADLLHLNAPALLGAANFPAETVVAAHSCLASWWRAVRRTALPPEWEWHKRLSARGLRRASVAIVPSAAFAADLGALHGPLPSLRVVPNAARPGPVRRKALEVLAAGRWWDEGKNLSALDAAAAGIDWPVLAAGSACGPSGETVRAEHLRLVGALDAAEMAEHYGRASIFISLSLYEPFGLAVLEAASAGAALVLSDIPTFREIWEGAALFVDPARPEEAARAVNSLIADPGFRLRLGRNAQLRAGRYSLRRQLEGLDAAYRDALSLRRLSA